MQVEEGLATPASFQFNGSSVVTMQELPTTGPWPDDVTQTNLIQCEQPVSFGFSWSVQGPLVALLSNPAIRWKLQLYFEKWGNTEFNIGGTGVNFVPYQPISGYVYNRTIQIPANTVPEGVYDIVGVLRLYNGNNPLPAAGFVEFGKVEFYETV